MAEAQFDFWKDHSIHFLEMALRSDKRERLENPDGYAKKTGECGDTVEIFLTVKDHRIERVCFDTNGCMSTTACANTVAHLAEGLSVDEAWEITPERVMAYLETLQSSETHCAELVVGTFYLALADARETKQHCLKKWYRRAP